MTSSAVLIAMASAAMLLPAGAASADAPTSGVTAAAAQDWGPYHSPGARRARTSGKIIATGEDHEVIPSAAKLTISGTVTDLARSSTCGWAVFDIATVNAAGDQVAWKRRHVRTCDYRVPKRFALTHRRVYQVNLKVCAERRAAGPSIQCTAGNPAWKVLYLSPH